MMVLSAAPETLSVGLAACLGALQGIAEFLPISSSGHLSLAQQWLGIDPAAGGHAFNITVHAGTLLAVLVYYRRDLLTIARGVVSGDAPARRMFLTIVVGTLPLVVALAPTVKQLVVFGEGSSRFVGAGLLSTAALLAFTHRRRAPVTGEPEPERQIGVLAALLIGTMQLLAVAPGVSRSGATIAAALALGTSRTQAARFSFLLSIPAVLGATLVELLPLVTQGAPAGLDPAVMLTGLCTSFVVGIVSLRLLLALIVRAGLLPFVPYLVILGLVAVSAP